MAGQIAIQFSTTPSVPFFWEGWKNRASFAIRWMGHSPFSHMDIELEDGSLLGASDQGPDSPYIEGSPLGVATRPRNYQLFGLRRRMVIRTHLADVIIDRVKTQLGKPFDKGGLNGFLSPAAPGPDSRDWRDQNQWWCSELILWAFEWEGYWIPVIGRDGRLPWPKTRVSPTDFLMIFLLDPNWVNRDTFWEPIPGLKLDENEI